MTHRQRLNARKSFERAALIFGTRTCRGHVFVPILFAMSNRPCPCDRWPGTVDPTCTCSRQPLVYEGHDAGSKRPKRIIRKYIKQSIRKCPLTPTTYPPTTHILFGLMSASFACKQKEDTKKKKKNI